ncbi:MAG: dihydroorotase [Phycisphaerae bacterium]|jgi:dihydroorotase|nr:dihydroorotase [Phycisphaerae bacterium]
MTLRESILIVNGTVIDPANNINDQANILIQDGKISQVGQDKPKAQTRIDATGLYVLPGLIDMHVHLREPGHEEEETIATGTRAAAAGGFTSIACMPNTHPVIDNEAAVDFIIRRAEDTGFCNVFPIGAITKNREGKELAEMGTMVRAGAVGFSDDGDGIADAGITYRAMQYLTMFGKVLIQHCEDVSLAGNGSMNGGKTANRLGIPGRISLAEQIMIYRDLLLAEATECKYHVAHVSTEGSVELIRQAKAKGLRHISAEVTPHHLALTEEACQTFDSNYKVAPPLRTARDIAAMKAALADGTIDCLATDHAPHSREEKELEFLYAPFGMIGMETALAIYIKTLIDDNTLDWPDLVAKMTINPAQVLGIQKGTLSANADADITLIDPDVIWTIDKERFFSRSRNCPFHGWQVHGRVMGTIVGGQIKHDDGLRIE